MIKQSTGDKWEIAKKYLLGSAVHVMSVASSNNGMAGSMVQQVSVNSCTVLHSMFRNQ